MVARATWKLSGVSTIGNIQLNSGWRRALAFFIPTIVAQLGMGYDFRKLTWGNSARAETIDILSAIDHLVDQGLADQDEVGTAGHSWGGYLSAFVATSTDRFKVASVGSGITNQRVNYVLSNAGVAKGGYLQSYPWENPTLWNAVSPVEYIKQAKTPTLIQHGEHDVVVPVANAHELRRGLADMGVPVQMALFNNSGHNIGRPKERLAWMHQNLSWFSRYLWEQDVSAPWK